MDAKEMIFFSEETYANLTTTILLAEPPVSSNKQIAPADTSEFRM